MPRIPYPDASAMTDEVRALVEKGGSNALKMYAYATPDAFLNFFNFTSVFFTISPLPADLRQVAVLRVAHIAGSDYVGRQHETLGRDMGLDDADIAAIRSDPLQPGALSPPRQAALAFADELVRQVRVSDATLSEMRGHLDGQQLMDLMMVIGAYMTMCRIIETTGAEIDAHQFNASFLSTILPGATAA